MHVKSERASVDHEIHIPSANSQWAWNAGLEHHAEHWRELRFISNQASKRTQRTATSDLSNLWRPPSPSDHCYSHALRPQLPLEPPVTMPQAQQHSTGETPRDPKFHLKLPDLPFYSPVLHHSPLWNQASLLLSPGNQHVAQPPSATRRHHCHESSTDFLQCRRNYGNWSALRRAL